MKVIIQYIHLTKTWIVKVSNSQDEALGQSAHRTKEAALEMCDKHMQYIETVSH